MTSRFTAFIRTAFLAIALLAGSLVALDLLVAFSAAGEFGPKEPITVVTAQGKTQFQVELADTDATREQGLMFRPTLPANEGMLFDFKRPQRVYFWMKNTYVPLDMIFIRVDGTVARIAEDTKPLSEDAIGSEAQVRFVLEVNAGTSAKIGLKPGDKVLGRLIRTTTG